MNPLVTVLVNPDGSSRISRITKHGEEVIVPNREVRAIATHLWSRVVAETLSHSVLDDELREHLRRLQSPLPSLDEALRRVASLETRCEAIEKENTRLTSALKTAIQRLNVQPVVVPHARGQ